jgi:L-lysine 2,3-aminomutase
MPEQQPERSLGRQLEALHFALNWQQQLSEAFSSIDDLCEYLQLSPSDLAVSSLASKQFPLRVPLSFAASMEKGNPNDPLLRQVLPVNDELIAYPGFNLDPVGDLQAAVQPGLLHKYHARVLLINTGSCAINCRYCFRRNFPYSELQLTKQQESSVLAYIQADNSISEVILSGGDPLLLSDARLQSLFNQLEAIPQIKRIRIHSRIPIVLPARVTDELVKILVNSNKQIVLVVHANHANEINERVASAIKSLSNKGITLLNQSVLLKGVNDTAQFLSELSEKLFAIGIIPYYLHLLDKAVGTGHFEVTESDANILIETVQKQLPGYLAPKLVKEIAGASSKQNVFA